MHNHAVLLPLISTIDFLRQLALILAVASAWGVNPAAAAAAENVTRLAHVEVKTTGISDAYAQAIARSVEAARRVAVDQFCFNMPDTIFVSATASPGSSTRLFNDGQDHINLTVPSEVKLRRPAVTGTFHIYGFCHEVGHMAMYRVIQQRKWLSSAGAEGWAHYAGSRILDAVYAAEGEKLWPDAYDYLADGTARLKQQLAKPKPDATEQAAGLWMSLGEIIGDKGLAALFSAWGKLTVDETKPGPDLRKAVLAQGDADQMAAWWQKAEPVLVVSTQKSGFAAQTRTAAQLKTPSTELAQDDGAGAGKSSMAGGGHAVRFSAPGKEYYLTAVRIYGSRYGYPQPPRENASIWLCDSNFNQIVQFPAPYSYFARGDAKWVTVPVRAMRVPEEFVVCVGFNPTATKGVYVSYDANGSGSSYTGLPGSKGRKFDKGDWMIRAVVQEAKE